MLRVLCPGLSRTGTFSLKQALEALGFGPCYHMDELFLHPGHVPVWRDAAGRATGWRELFEGYASAADAPCCHFWAQIRAAFPECKVVLTVRDPEDWYRSFHATVREVMLRPELVPVEHRPAVEVTREIVLDRAFGGRIEDKAHALRTYAAHNQAVIDATDPGSLLVYDVSTGWDPLCDFLGVEPPARPFPSTNDRRSFRARLGLE